MCWVCKYDNLVFNLWVLGLGGVGVDVDFKILVLKYDVMIG